MEIREFLTASRAANNLLYVDGAVAGADKAKEEVWALGQSDESGRTSALSDPCTTP